MKFSLADPSKIQKQKKKKIHSMSVKIICNHFINNVIIIIIKMFLIVLRPKINYYHGHPLSPNNLLFLVVHISSEKNESMSDQHSFDWGTWRCYVCCLQPFPKQSNHQPNRNVDRWMSSNWNEYFFSTLLPAFPSNDSIERRFLMCDMR